MKESNNFKDIFWDAFYHPKLETEKFTQLWNTLEHVNNMLAGPFYSIYSEGNCDYVFKDKSKFPNIHDSDDFLDYCMYFVNLYHDKVKNTEAESEEEKNDKQLLLYQTDMKMELANLAYQIQKERINPQGKE